MNIDIFTYLNYRTFLKDLYEWNKKNDSYFSYRYLAQKAGFSSPNFVKLVIDGKRNLTLETISIFADIFKLKKTEAEYFKNLVLMNQAQSSTERKKYADILFKSSFFKKIAQLNKDQFEYYSHWYMPVIKELITAGAKINNPAWFAKICEPEISENQAKEAIETLLRLGLIIKKNNQLLVSKESLLSTGNEISSLLVANFHRTMFEFASRSIDTIPREERDISGLTFSVSREGMQEIKERIQLFRKELLAIAEKDKNSEQIYQLSIQLFPLTKGMDK